jgi:predicted AlkP superfamily pyrophosphatase or phosphodiesterase
LDYNSQRYGPNHSSVVVDLQQIDAVCGELIQFYEQRGARVIVLSEYGITPVRRPVHLNRALRRAGLLQVRTERGRELLDAGASRAFALADHQVAHVYINDPTCTAQVRQIVSETPGVELVLDQAGQALHQLDHPRSGQLVAVADQESWFTYYYWLDDARAPDFARIVDIHKKPGYDPLEMLVDPKIPLPWLKVGFTLLKKKLGFRYLMDVIPLDATLIGGSHGRLPEDPRDWPVYLGPSAPADHLLPHQVFEKIAKNLGFLA